MCKIQGFLWRTSGARDDPTWAKFWEDVQNVPVCTGTTRDPDQYQYGRCAKEPNPDREEVQFKRQGIQHVRVVRVHTRTF